MKFAFRNLTAVISLFLASNGAFIGAARADVPTPLEMCKFESAARCKINNVEFVEERPCPPGSITLKLFEEKNCAAIVGALATKQSVPVKNPPSRSSAPHITEPASPGSLLLSWAIPLAFLTLTIFLVISRLKKARKNEGPRQSVLLKGVTTTVSIIVGLFAARFAFIKTFEVIQNRDTIFAVIPALFAGFAALIAAGSAASLAISLLFKPKIEIHKKN